MRPLTAKKLICVLIANGFILARQKGSHAIYRHSNNGIIVPKTSEAVLKKNPQRSTCLGIQIDNIVNFL